MKLNAFSMQLRLLNKGADGTTNRTHKERVSHAVLSLEDLTDVLKYVGSYLFFFFCGRSVMAFQLQ